MTSPHKGAGVGHQWMNWQLGAILAKKWNYKFVHSSLDSKRSGGDWDNFLGFGEGYLTEHDVKDVPVKNIPRWDYGFDKTREEGKENLIKLKQFIEEGPENTVYKFPYSHFQGIVAEDLPLIRSELQQKYFKRHSDPTESFTVSLHMRRGDIDSKNNSNRWLDNDFYINWIDRIKKVLDDNSVEAKFILFSTTGRTGEFDDFQPFVERRIDGDPFEDFNWMVHSDILFAGLSSYSIMSATLNKNFCFYCPLRTYTLWMDGHSTFSNAYNKNIEKFKNVINF